MGDVFKKGPIELRLGDYRDVLSDVEPDAVLVDPPYSKRTHAGHDIAVTGLATGCVNERERRYGHADSAIRQALTYTFWQAADVDALFHRFGDVDGWVCAFSDHVLVMDYERAAGAAGRYAFSPIAWWAPGSRVRMLGDGPARWTTEINVSRPRAKRFCSWGALPGGYQCHTQSGGHIGGKPLALMRALVRDYSRPGDLVCDPCSGGATTLIAAALEGRRAIGAELDPETYAKACARIARTALTPPLPGLEREPMNGAQDGFDL